MSATASFSGRKTHNCSSWGLINNYRYLARAARNTMVLRAVESAKARKKCQRKNKVANLKRTRTEPNTEKPETANKTLKKIKLWSDVPDSDRQTSNPSLNSSNAWAHVSKFELKLSCPLEASQSSRLKETKELVRPNHLNFVGENRAFAAAAAIPRESWEVDSGFSSETSPPASGCTSPSPGLALGMVVSLDCEMVGTGPGGRCSELARCSVLDYHGNVIYDKYVQPCQPVTDYRTRWSGIQRHHLRNALPFDQARSEVLELLKGKVVVGHALFNDFQALDLSHPGHMIRDTSSTALLRRLIGSPIKHRLSLKILANKLLDRKIQVGRRGHCSVEDARAALDLYKLVESQWEQELRDMLRDPEPSETPSNHYPGDPVSNHYMQDQYWPDNLTEDSQ